MFPHFSYSELMLPVFPLFVFHLCDVSAAEKDLKSEKEMCEELTRKSLDLRKYPDYNKLTGSGA